MTDLQLNLINTPENLKRCFRIMKELRPHLEYQAFADIYEYAHEADGYEIVGLEKDGQIVAVMGYRFLYDYVHGKHVYIDDLVTTESVRSKGAGSQLLKYAESIAQQHNCMNLRLCTGIENEQGKKFYERNGWNVRAIVYKKKII
ncbi:MAG: GNAT family N-acetyltransferase [Bdellovibrionaceae bacterium]|nr:GNAT family N-acetyltransferase [Pseudobdellovibrionaceae bacterium]